MLSILHFFNTALGRTKQLASAGVVSLRHATYNNPGQLVEMVKSFIPSLSNTQHKGMMGRIGIVGGSQEYTGAPFFAAISSLKSGADLSHVFCTKAAGPVIKSYSPELIVHSMLDEADFRDNFGYWLERINCIILGPGLGRDRVVMDRAKDVISLAKEKNIPIVVDADGLFVVTENPKIIENYGKVVLTPNVVEFKRLYQKVMGEDPDEKELVLCLKNLCKALGNVTIVHKGEVDLISNGNHVLVCSVEGSPRRCGGQGDLLAGAMGTFMFWAHDAVSKTQEGQLLKVYGANICAAYGSCLLTRECSREAFKKHRRSMVTSDMVNQIQSSFEKLFDN